MNKTLSLLFMLVAMAAQAQPTGENKAYTVVQADLTGRWIGPAEAYTNGKATYIIKADGTKTMIATQTFTYPIAGINIKMDLIQNRTDEKWVVKDNALERTAIPLALTLDVKYEKYGNFTAAQKQKINAALPAFKRQGVTEAKQDWQRLVGKKLSDRITSYTPKQMKISDGTVLTRDTVHATTEEKAAYEAANKRYNEYLLQQAKAQEAALLRQKAIDDAYWASLGTEKTESGKRAEAEGVKAVDLGLSVRWASANIGATSPYLVGNYYAWGELNPKDNYSEKTYNVKTKYKKGDTLLPADDAATQHWGTGWHIPTLEQWRELFHKCKFEELDTPESGQWEESLFNTWAVKVTGPNGNFIILPFHRGRAFQKSTCTEMGDAAYWANCLTEDSKSHGSSAQLLSRLLRGELKHFIYDEGVKDCVSREFGLPIRAVME